MAHFARIDENNIVQQIIVVDNENITDETGNESEELGVAYLTAILGSESIFKRTSYNGKIRKNYAGKDYTWDETRDAFIPPKPDEGNWKLCEETCNWINLD